jgi:hypothetical protein
MLEFPLTAESKGRKRPRDPNQLAKMIVDIASGEIEDRDPTPEEQGKDPQAVKRGRAGGARGGPARAASLSPEERSEAARKAVWGRWSRR